MDAENVHVLITGGGIVGLAAAREILRRFPDLRVSVLEKEAGLARHQTGHNSGVIHSGVYYRPGSYKATLCRRGYALLLDFCREKNITHEICGKLIVAVSEEELPRLEALRRNAEANGIREAAWIPGEAIRDFEPHARGVRALRVPETGIVDYRAVAEKLAEDIRGRGGRILTGRKVNGLRNVPKGKIVSTEVEGGKGGEEFRADFFINCGGLLCDRLARLDGLNPDVTIVPFRGEYYELIPAARGRVRNLIYPVPDPAFPFLGVHLTRMIGGGVECGPNAVWAWKREGYRKSDVSLKDVWETLRHPGFRALAARHWRMGLGEFRRSFSKAAFARALRRLVPEVETEMLASAGSGVRAQALRRDGSLVDDFLFAEGAGSLHVLNAPSPAATASLAIAEEIADRYARLSG